MKTVAILGATGSVGRQALDVCRARGYRVDLLTAHRSVAAMETAAREFRPRFVIMTDPEAAEDLRLRLADTSIRVEGGDEAELSGIAASVADVFVNAVTGEAGLLPTLAVLDTGRRLALANKESLVIAGDLVMARARERGQEILPVDSEHCAIAQSLRAGSLGEIRRLILTASGGPFRDMTAAELAAVTPQQTLAHPTWQMGPRITVDSATLMNKGFEVIEAAWLFGVPPEKIEVVVHPESILHSAVEYIDYAVIGEFSVPDMRMCVQYAVDFPSRQAGAGAPLDLFSLGKMTFRAPDTATFPLLTFAPRTAFRGGGMGAVLNAADEVAVAAFLRGDIPFPAIADTVMHTVEALSSCETAVGVTDRLTAAATARRLAGEYIRQTQEKKGICL